MLRLAVACYLMFVTAVGPAACCCTFSRLALRFSEPASAPDSRPAPCCRHSAPEQPPPDAPGKTPSPSKPDSPGCPCKQSGEREVTGLPPAPGESLELSVRGAFGELLCPLALSASHAAYRACDTQPFREAAGPGPSVSTDELLYAFHILRC